MSHIFAGQEARHIAQDALDDCERVLVLVCQKDVFEGAMLEVGFHPISLTEGEPQAAVVTSGTEGYIDAIWRVASHALAAAPGTSIVEPHRSHG